MEIIEQFYVIGIAIRTTNENQQSASDIAALWQRFFQDNIADQIRNKVNDTIYCLYTHYEDDFRKPYSTILGYAVTDIEQVPAGMTAIAIPSAPYLKITTQGNIHHGIVIDEWVRIWNSDLKRAYSIDFESYTFGDQPEDTQVDIFIAV